LPLILLRRYPEVLPPECLSPSVFLPRPGAVPDQSAEIYEFAGCRLDVGERTLERRQGRERIVIPEKAFRTLAHLVRHSGSLVTREAILAAVWADVVVEDGNVAKMIHVLRTALGDLNGAACIETIPKHGYRFVAEVKRVDTAATSSPIRSTAYDLYIRGKVKAGSENVDDTNEAITLLEAAVELDPSYAAAYAQLARAYNTRSFKFTSQSDGKRFRDHADVALAKALDLNPSLAEAHFARGLVLWTNAKGFPHEQAIRSFRRALELDDHADEAHHQLSMVYSHVGLLDEAAYHVGRAVELNPNNTMARFRVGVYAAWQCRFDEALAVMKTVPSEVSPFLVDRVKAEVYIQLGRLDKAGPIVDAYLAGHPNDAGGGLTSVRALLLARAGEARTARATIARAIKLGAGFGHFHHTSYNIAATYAALDEPVDAMRWLEATADDGFPCYPYFQRDPNLDPLRDSPRFMDLMATLREQWRRFRQITEASC
jgi:DNA-binding winged helix-turn-helix (wHTH) protein/Tfp pilus assembly protein PilF